MPDNLSKLPVFMHDSKTNEIIREVISAIPPKTDVYLLGGAARNAVYYRTFGKKLPQRDYDLEFRGDKNKFIRNLRKLKFSYGKIRRKKEITMKKAIVSSPNPKIFSDYVYLDIHFTQERDIAANIKRNANFTINGFAIPLKEVSSENWYNKTVCLPKAIKDIKNRQIRVNAIVHPANLYAVLRFMSQGFKAPSKKEISNLLIALKKLPKYKFKRNVKKVFDYVGGKQKALKLAKQLGINQDIFDINILRSMN